MQPRYSKQYKYYVCPSCGESVKTEFLSFIGTAPRLWFWLCEDCGWWAPCNNSGEIIIMEQEVTR
jgi:translation initiation factor 2 beta subunit (eIF-2beta)/eIF-5